ncbi:Gp49 family protein [Aeromonas hydrophila]
MSDQQIEQEIQAKGLTAPRVTQQRINYVIVSERYFTAAQGVVGSGGIVMSDDDGIRCLTFCVLTLENGFTVTGESACASPENFSAELGRKIARENAINKVWMLEGYLLKQQLHDAQNAVVLADADALADLNGIPRHDNPSVAS